MGSIFVIPTRTEHLVDGGRSLFTPVHEPSHVVFRSTYLKDQFQQFVRSGCECRSISLDGVHPGTSSSGETLARQLLEQAHQTDVFYVISWPTANDDSIIQHLAVLDSCWDWSRNVVGETQIATRYIDEFVTPGAAQLHVDSLELHDVFAAAPHHGGQSPLTPRVDNAIHSVIPLTIDSTVALLARSYPQQTELILVDSIHNTSRRVALQSLRAEWQPRWDVIFIPRVPLLQDTRSAEGVQHIVARLRAPGGCPWDREQTHQSITKNLLEEAYEVIDAIESGDQVHLREELGDLLLQAYLHAQIAEDTSGFTLEDILQALGEKLVRRHPHVFGDHMADDTGAVLRTWDEIKRHERGGDSNSDPRPLGTIPRALPALMRLQKVIKRGRRAERFTVETGVDRTTYDTVSNQDLLKMLIQVAALADRNDSELELQVSELSLQLEAWASEAGTNPIDDAQWASRGVYKGHD